MVDVRLTLGSVQAGALVSTALSGAVCFQIFLYFRHYRDDPWRLKSLVLLVWALDAAQTVLIAVMTWQYLILNFSNSDIADYIPRTVPASVTFTALLTFVVNGYYTMRVHRLSKGNWWFTAPTIFFLVARLGLALVSTAAMTKLKSFERFSTKFGPVFTAGLSTSAFTDVIITFGLCYYLRALNHNVLNATKMLKVMVIFADNNGAVTCLVALASLFCWVTMPHNLIFLAFHFSIGKLYSNSFLATLNMRDYLKRSAAKTPVDVNLRPSARPRTFATDVELQASGDDASLRNVGTGYNGQHLEIKVDTTIHYD